MVPCSNPNDHQEYNQGRTDCHEDCNKIKQFLISSYKKTLHPLIRDDIHRNIDDDATPARGPRPSRCKLITTSFE